MKITNHGQEQDDPQKLGFLLENTYAALEKIHKLYTDYLKVNPHGEKLSTLENVLMTTPYIAPLVATIILPYLAGFGLFGLFGGVISSVLKVELEVKIEEIIKKSDPVFFGNHYKLMKNLAELEDKFLKLIPTEVAKKMPTINGLFSKLYQHDYIYAYLPISKVKEMLAKDPSIGEDIVKSFINSGSRELEAVIKEHNLTLPYLADYKVTEHGAYFKPKGKIKGTYILVMGKNFEKREKLFANILLKQGYEVILQDEDFCQIGSKYQKIFEHQTPIRGIYFNGHGNSIKDTNTAPKAHYMIGFDTLKYLAQIRKAHKGQFAPDLELGVLSCHSGVLNKKRVLTIFPEVNNLYLSSAGDYVTISPASSRFSMEAERYDFDGNITPLDFFYRFHSIMLPRYYVYEQNISKMKNLLEMLKSNNLPEFSKLLSEFSSAELKPILVEIMSQDHNKAAKIVAERMESIDLLPVIIVAKLDGKHEITDDLVPYLAKYEIVLFKVLFTESGSLQEDLTNMTPEERAEIFDIIVNEYILGFKLTDLAEFVSDEDIRKINFSKSNFRDKVVEKILGNPDYAQEFINSLKKQDQYSYYIDEFSKALVDFSLQSQNPELFKIAYSNCEGAYDKFKEIAEFAYKFELEEFIIDRILKNPNYYIEDKLEVMLKVLVENGSTQRFQLQFNRILEKFKPGNYTILKVLAATIKHNQPIMRQKILEKYGSGKRLADILTKSIQSNEKGLVAELLPMLMAKETNPDSTIFEFLICQAVAVQDDYAFTTLFNRMSKERKQEVLVGIVKDFNKWSYNTNNVNIGFLFEKMKKDEELLNSLGEIFSANKKEAILIDYIFSKPDQQKELFNLFRKILFDSLDKLKPKEIKTFLEFIRQDERFPNNLTQSELSAVFYSAILSDEALFNQLLQSSIDLPSTNSKGETPMAVAVQKQQFNSAILMLHNEKFATTISQKDLKELFFSAISADKRDLVKQLIKNPKFELKDLQKRSYSPLLHSIRNKRMEITELLIQDTNYVKTISEEELKSAFRIAAERNMLDRLLNILFNEPIADKALVALHKTIADLLTEDIDTLIVILGAVKTSNVPIDQDHFRDVNMTKALEKALERHDKHVLKFIFSLPFLDLNKKASNGQTILELAVSQPKENLDLVIREYLKRQVVPDKLDEILKKQIMNGSLRRVRALMHFPTINPVIPKLEAGDNNLKIVNLIKEYTHNPVKYAIENNFDSESMKILLQKKFSTLGNLQKKEIIRAAIKKERVEVIEQLIDLSKGHLSYLNDKQLYTEISDYINSHAEEISTNTQEYILNSIQKAYKQSWRSSLPIQEILEDQDAASSRITKYSIKKEQYMKNPQDPIFGEIEVNSLFKQALSQKDISLIKAVLINAGDKLKLTTKLEKEVVSLFNVKLKQLKAEGAKSEAVDLKVRLQQFIQLISQNLSSTLVREGRSTAPLHPPATFTGSKEKIGGHNSDLQG